MLLNIIIGLALLIIGYLIMPRQNTETEITELESPTAEAGIPWGVVFGDKIVKTPNYLWWGDKSYATKTAKTGKK